MATSGNSFWQAANNSAISPSGLNSSTETDSIFLPVLSFGVTASRQDFPFRNENGTLYDPSDDFEDRQRNARFTQRHAFTSARVRIGRGELHAVYLGIGRDGA